MVDIIPPIIGIISLVSIGFVWFVLHKLFKNAEDIGLIKGECRFL